MSCTQAASDYLIDHGIYYLPGKASNAGGVTVSGFEIEQAKRKEKYSFEKVDSLLKGIMEGIFDNIYKTCKDYSKENDFRFGANLYSYLKLENLISKKEGK